MRSRASQPKRAETCSLPRHPLARIPSAATVMEWLTYHDRVAAAFKGLPECVQELKRRLAMASIPFDAKELLATLKAKFADAEVRAARLRILLSVSQQLGKVGPDLPLFGYPDPSGGPRL